MAEKEKSRNWGKWIFGIAVIAVLFFGAIYIINNQKSPAQQTISNLNEFVEEIASKTANKIKESFQDEKNPLKVAKMEVAEQTVNTQKVETQQVTTSKVEKQEVAQQNVTKQDVKTQTVETSTVQKQTVVEQTVTNQKVENQWVENSTVQNQTVENQTVTNQTVDNQTVNCQKLGNCGGSVSIAPAPCDNKVVETRPIVTVTERKCWNGDIWSYINGIRQNLVESCGRTEYFSGSSYYRCSGNYREWKEKIVRSCVQSGSQAYCHAEEVWRVVESCPYGCENSMCKQKVIIQEPVCTTGCCSGGCDQPTVIVNNNIIINNQTDPVPVSQQVIAPPPPPPPPTVSSGCTQNCTPVEIEGSSGTYVPPAPLPPAPAPAPSAVVTTCTTCSSGWSPP